MINALIDALGPWLVEQNLFRYVMVFEQQNFRVFCSALASFLVVVLCGRRVIRWLAMKKIGDHPEFDHAEINEKMKSKANTPTMGGILIAGAVLVSTLLFADLGNDYVRMALFVLLWHAGVGGADDWLKLTAASRGAGARQGLYSWEKLVFQLGIGAVIGYFAFTAGGVGQEMGAAEAPRLAHVLNLPFQKTWEARAGDVAAGLGYLPLFAYMAVMTLYMAGMSNAVNITDGMDGLAAGCAGIVGVGLVVLSIVAGDEAAARELLVPYVPSSGELAVFAAAITGACFGFLWWNCSPAHVFMGDTGSLCLGGSMGYVAVVVRGEIVVLVMCGVFAWEILSVVLQVGYFKWTRGRRIFRCAPYHHHLHILGWPEQRIVVRFWIISIVLTAIALASLKVR